MSRYKPSTRRMIAEPLEDRRLLSSDSGAFFGFGSLTASFAPDNTQIGFRSSELFAAFDERFGPNQWQPVIERAIQTWVREAELNIGFVEDSGEAAGTYGPSQGDSRFGDVRFFGVSLGQDVWAEAVSENSRAAGTWAGDIIFNVDADWRNLQDLETVALHELGHVFGLEHSNDPNSIMNAHGPSSNTNPTQAEIAILRSLHGARDPDPSEGAKGNDTIQDSPRIRGNENDGISTNDNFDGSQVWLQFGDLLDVDDVDVFEISISSGYSGPLAVNLRTEGLSLAKANVEITDRDENVLASGTVDNLFGGQTTVHLDSVDAGEKYYVRISSTSAAVWSQGDYAITIGTPGNLASQEAEIAKWGDMVHRWYFDSHGAKRGFSYHLRSFGKDGFSDDDGHTDDDRSHARIANPALSSDSRIVYSAVGTVSDVTDVDYIQFSTPKLMDANAKLLINLESLEPNALVPQISLLDRDGVTLDAELLSVGYGATQLLVHNIVADTRYLIRLDSTGVDAAHRTGNYALNLELSTLLTSNDQFAVGTVSENTVAISRTLYLAIPQIITFSLQSSFVSGATTDATQAAFQLFNSQRKLIHNIIAPIGTMRSLPGVLLDAGEYFLQVSVVSAASNKPTVDVELSGTRPTDPIGPMVAPVDSEPIYACEVGGDFCFPDGAESTIPSHVGAGPLTPLPPPLPAPIPPPPDVFFWKNDLVIATNYKNANDTNGDGNVAPVDALIVINFLRTTGPRSFPTQFVGYIDTNADGLISAIDAILVINEIKRARSRLI